MPAAQLIRAVARTSSLSCVTQAGVTEVSTIWGGIRPLPPYGRLRRTLRGGPAGTSWRHAAGAGREGPLSQSLGHPNHATVALGPSLADWAQSRCWTGPHHEITWVDDEVAREWAMGGTAQDHLASGMAATTGNAISARQVPWWPASNLGWALCRHFGEQQSWCFPPPAGSSSLGASHPLGNINNRSPPGRD